MGSKLNEPRKDKIIRERIGNFDLYLYRSHQLPKILKEWPHYSSNLGRLAKHLLQKYPDMVLLDIGANIGDTVALLKSVIDLPMICVEGYEKYFTMLQKNIEQFQKVSAYQYYLGEKNQTVSSVLNENKGSMAIDGSLLAEHISMITLDEFVKRHLSALNVKLIKIDTDGFDLNIIAGGFEFLQNAHPVLFFEFDIDCMTLPLNKAFKLFEALENMGYADILYFDNYGRFLLSDSIKNKHLMQQLLFYTKQKQGRFEYFDIALFHQDDKEVARRFINSEMALAADPEEQK